MSTLEKEVQHSEGTFDISSDIFDNYDYDSDEYYSLDDFDITKEKIATEC